MNDNVDEDLALSVMDQESSFRPVAVSGAGATGLMQLEPAAAAEVGVTDRTDPEQNVAGGIKYLDKQISRFGSRELGLAAYNAGPGTVAGLLKNGNTSYEDIKDSLPAETQAYVPGVLEKYGARKDAKPVANGDPETPDNSPGQYVGKKGTVPEFKLKLEGLVTSPAFSDMTTTERIRQLNRTYQDEPWVDGVKPLIKQVATEFWKGARPEEDITSAIADRVGPIPSAETAKENGTNLKELQNKVEMGLAKQGVLPEIYGNHLDNYFNDSLKEENTKAEVRNRGTAGILYGYGKEFVRGAGEGLANPISALPELLNYQETSDYIKDIPNKIMGDKPRDFYFQTYKDGRIATDEFGKPMTKLAGSIASGLGQGVSLLAGGATLKAYGATNLAAKAVFGGVNGLSAIDSGYNYAKSAGASHGEAVTAGLIALPFSELQTVGDLVVTGFSKPFIRGLTGLNKAKAISNVLVRAGEGAAIQGGTGALQELANQGSAVAVTGNQGIYNKENVLHAGAIGALTGAVIHPLTAPNISEGGKAPPPPPAPDNGPYPQSQFYNPNVPDAEFTSVISGALPAPENVSPQLALPAPQNLLPAPQTESPGPELKRLPVPPRFDTSGNPIQGFERPSAKEEQRIAEALQKFQESNQLAGTLTVRSPADVPVELLKVTGMEATVIGDNKIAIARKTNYTPQELGEDLSAVENKIDQLHDHIRTNPDPSEVQNLHLEQAELVKKLSGVNESELKPIADERRGIIQRITSLKREVKKASIAGDRLAASRKLEFANQDLAELDARANEVNSRMGEDIKTKGRLDEVSKTLTDMRSSDTYANDITARQVDLAYLLKRRQELADQSAFTSSKQSGIGETGLEIAGEKRNLYALPTPDGWYITDPTGKPVTKSFNYLHQAMKLGEHLVDNIQETPPSRTTPETFIDPSVELTPEKRAELEKQIAERDARAAQQEAAIADYEKRTALSPEAAERIKAKENRDAQLEQARKAYETESLPKQQKSSDGRVGIKRGESKPAEAPPKPEEPTNNITREQIAKKNAPPEKPPVKATQAKGKKGKATKGKTSSKLEVGDSLTEEGATQDTANTNEADPVNSFSDEKKAAPIQQTRRRESKANGPVDATKFTQKKDFVADKRNTVSVKKVVKQLENLAKTLPQKFPIFYNSATGKALGIANWASRAIGIKHPDDFQTTIHELGHAIDYTLITPNRYKDGQPDYSILSQELQDGLKLQAKTYYPTELPEDSAIREGMSVFLDHYTSGQSTVKAVEKWWNNDFKSQNPEVHEAVESIKSLITDYYEQHPTNRAIDFVSGKKDAGKPEVTTGVASRWVDDGDIYKKIDKASGNKNRTHDKFHAMRGRAENQSDYFVNRGKLGENGTPIPGLSLKQMLSPAEGKFDLLAAYMAASKVDAIYTKRNLLGGLAQEDAATTIADIRANHPEVAKVANEVWGNYQKGVLDYAGSKSPYMQKFIDKLRAENLAETGQEHGFYSPFTREGKEFASKFTKSITGSTARILNPVESLGDWTTNTLKMADQRQFTEGLLALGANYNPNDPSTFNTVGKYIRKLGGNDLALAKSNFDAAAAEVKVSDPDAANNPTYNEFLSLANPLMGNKDGGAFSQYSMYDVNGKQHFFEISNELVKTLHPDTPEFFNNTAVKYFMTYPKQIVQASSTTLRPTFAFGKNLGRDAVTYFLNVHDANPIHMIQDVLGTALGATFHTLSGGKINFMNYKEWENLSSALGAQSSSRAGSPDSIRRIIETNTGRKVVDFALETVSKYEELLSIPEKTFRLAAVRSRARELGIGPTDRMTAAQALELNLAYRRTTTDFSVQGTSARNVNRIVPFFTAPIAGLITTARGVKENPGRHMLLGAGMFAYAIKYAFDHKDDEWFRNVDLENQTNNILLPTEDGKLMRIPLEEWSRVFWTTGLAVGTKMFREGDALAPSNKEYFGRLFNDNLPSVNPVNLGGVLVKEIVQQTTNYDFYKGKSIEPDALKYTPAVNRTTDYTTKLAENISRVMYKIGGPSVTISPIKIDHAIRSMSAVGADAVTAAEQLGGVGKPADIDKANPVLNMFLHYQATNNIADRGTQKFYELSDEMQFKKDIETPEGKKLRSQMNSIRKDLTTMRQAITTLGDNPEMRSKLLEVKQQLLNKGIALATGTEYTNPDGTIINEGNKLAAQAKKEKKTANVMKLKDIYDLTDDAPKEEE